VDLGEGKSVVAVDCGQQNSCALLTSGEIKCWGLNASGQLGLGDTETRGNVPGEMGDALPGVDLGDTASVAAISVGSGHSCALFAGGAVKCWGTNQWGELGLGDTNTRGNEPGEMGDALPYVDL